MLEDGGKKELPDGLESQCRNELEMAGHCSSLLQKGNGEGKTRLDKEL